MQAAKIAVSRLGRYQTPADQKVTLFEGLYEHVISGLLDFEMERITTGKPVFWFDFWALRIFHLSGFIIWALRRVSGAEVMKICISFSFHLINLRRVALLQVDFQGALRKKIFNYNLETT